MFRKWCLALSIVFSVCVGVYYYDTILNAAVRTYLENKTSKLGIPFTYSHVDSSPNRLEFYETSAELQGATIRAKKLVVEHHIHPLARHADIKIQLEDPCFNVEKELVDLESVIQQFTGGSSFFTVSCEIVCRDGSLSLCSENEKKIFFDFNHCWSDAKDDKCIHKGTYFLNLNEKDKTSTLQMVFSAEDSANVKLHANLQKVNAEKLAETIKPFVPELATWNFKQGLLDGEFAFELANAKFAQGKGELTISGIEAEEQKLGISVAIKKAIFRTDAKTGNASLDILDNGFIIFNDGETYASFKDFNGKIEITEADHLEMNLSGIWEDANKPLHTELKGCLHLDDFVELFAKISLRPVNIEEEAAFISIDAKKLGSCEAIAEIDLQKFGPKQFHFWQRVIERVFPGLNPITYHSGTLNAVLTVNLDKDILKKVTVDNIDAANVAFTIKRWDAAFEADRLLGQFAINLLHPNPQETVNADIHISNGQASLIGLENFWQFDHIETHLSVRDGVVQKSFASVELAGLKGSAVVNSFSEEEILRFAFEGNAMDLKPFLPKRIQSGIEKKFLQDHLIVNASVSKIAKGVNVVGELKIKNQSTAYSPITFGFDIERSPKEVLQPNFYEHTQNVFQALERLSPSYLHSLSHLEERLLLQEIGIQGFVLRKGWFGAANVGLEKFVSPFLFEENNFSLKGVSNISGTFDHLGLALQYDARSLILENDDLNIDVPKVFSLGNHYFDFISGKHFGELPLKNGSYFDKNSGLLFTEVSAHVIFEGKKVHVLDVDAFSNGLYFGGIIDIDYSSPQKGYFDLTIMINTLHGKVSQMQHFFSHFNKPFFFQTLSLEGDLALRNKGCKLSFHFHPEDFSLTTVVDGNISDALLKPENSEFSVNALSLDFFYDSSRHLLNFSDIHGTLNTGKSSAIEEYTLHSNNIHFSNFENNEAQFDIWVKDQNRDLIRLSGMTTTEMNENNEKEIVFSFDEELTHFGEIHPKKIVLALKDWTKIAELKLDFSSRLSSLLYDLQRFSKSGLLASSPQFLKEIGSLKNAGGVCDVSLNYDAVSSAFKFFVQGKDVAFDRYAFKNVVITGKNQDRIWTIDQLQLDQLSLAAEFTKIDSLWKANFLGLRYGKSLLIGMDGEYVEGEDSVKARINLLEANLAKLKEWPELAGLVKQYSPQGILRGSGEISVEMIKNAPWRFDLDLDASLSNGKVKELEIVECDHFTCHYSSDQGITFKDISAAVAVNGEPVKMQLDSVDFDPVNDNLLFNGWHFNVPSELLPHFAASLRSNFPDLVSDDFAAVISQIKKSDSLVGVLNVKKLPSHTELQLQLAEGTYYFADKEHFLRSFSLHSEPKNISFSTQYQYNKYPFFLSGTIDAEQFRHGALTLTDAMHQADTTLPPLVIHWYKDEHKGFVIRSANGFFGGMKIQLQDSVSSPSTSMALHLDGEVTTLSSQFRHLLDAEISEQILKWQVGQGYVLHGTFAFAKEPVKNERPLSFYGTMSGQDFHLKGYQFKQLQSQVLFGPQVIQISDLSITDPAGALYINQIIITKDGEKDHLVIPQLNIQELRPSFLVEVGKPYPNQKKPLVIRELHVHDVKGILGLETSFTGSGSLHFNNPVKKHLQNTIFAFPAEILTRIGLDLSVLTPVTGTINYEIQDGKVYLTRFKDIYSDSKLSRFYLPNSRHASFMDFDGNLNIQVKMKQHTLIFKLAELFTVTIQGNLQKPTYTLLRQKPLRRSEVIASSETK